MTDLEAKARANHRNGNNCSTSLAMAFADVLGVSEAEPVMTWLARRQQCSKR